MPHAPAFSSSDIEYVESEAKGAKHRGFRALTYLEPYERGLRQVVEMLIILNAQKKEWDVEFVLTRTTNVDGFMGGSSGERFPVEKSVTEVTRRFKEIPI